MPWLQWSRESHRAASADVLTALTENGIHPSLGIRASICVMSVCLPFLFLRRCWWKKRVPPLLPSRCTTRAFSGAVRFRWSPRRTQCWPLSSVRRRNFPLVKLSKVFLGVVQCGCVSLAQHCGLLDMLQVQKRKMPIYDSKCKGLLKYVVYGVFWGFLFSPDCILHLCLFYFLLHLMFHHWIEKEIQNNHWAYCYSSGPIAECASATHSDTAFRKSSQWWEIKGNNKVSTELCVSLNMSAVYCGYRPLPIILSDFFCKPFSFF